MPANNEGDRGKNKNGANISLYTVVGTVGGGQIFVVGSTKNDQIGNSYTFTCISTGSDSLS